MDTMMGSAQVRGRIDAVLARRDEVVAMFDGTPAADYQRLASYEAATRLAADLARAREAEIVDEQHFVASWRVPLRARTARMDALYRADKEIAALAAGGRFVAREAFVAAARAAVRDAACRAALANLAAALAAVGGKISEIGRSAHAHVSTTYEVKIGAATLEAIRAHAPGNVSLTKALESLDRQLRIRAGLAAHGIDDRIWPVVAGIEASGVGRVVYAGSALASYHRVPSDIFGREVAFHPEVRTAAGRKKSGEWMDPSVEVGGVRMAVETWKEAAPMVQAALDALGVEFVADENDGALRCKAGRFAMEAVETTADGATRRAFDPAPTNAGTWCRCAACHRRATGRRFEPFGYIVGTETRLVRVDGWARCGECRRPVRPAEVAAS